MRMLAAEYGADLCYSEELIDRRLGACSRVLNDALGTTDFVDASGVVRSRTAHAGWQPALCRPARAAHAPPPSPRAVHAPPPAGGAAHHSA